MRIYNVSPYGWTNHMIYGRANAGDSVFFVFRGEVYVNQPVWRTLVAHFSSRFLRKTGLGRDTASVIAVVASTSCGKEPLLPWDQLR